MSNTNLQDKFLGEYQEEGCVVTIFLINGFQMKGKVIDFDKYVVQIEVNDKNHLIYKHAISTFVKQ
jgi:host factor-I protein